MALIVMKFGGTSVGDATCIRRAATIVKEHSGGNDQQVVVVVSALSKITDLILKVMNAARDGKGEEMRLALAQLSARHEQVLGELFDGAELEQVSTEVSASIRRLSELASAVLLLGSATPQVMDMALPLGEQISARIFVACLKKMGRRGEFVDSARVVITDEKFGDASPDMEATRRRSREVIVPRL